MPKPVIFIPGFPASELDDAASGATVYPPSPLAMLDPAKKQQFLNTMIDVPGSLVAGPPIASLLGGVVQEAQSIYNILRDQFGYDVSGVSDDFIPIGWDWRQSISSAPTLAAVTAALDKLSPDKSGNVVAIVHSTGGLVLRGFLEQNPAYAACFEQVLAFGVPWAGTLASLKAMMVGESIGFLFIKVLTDADSRLMISHALAAYDLLPADKTTNLFSANGQPTTPLADQSWITQQYMRDLAAKAHGPFPRQFDDLPVTNVCGWGASTTPTCTLVAGALTFLPGVKDAGDGTVPFVSSSWLQGADVRSMYLPIGAYATGFLPKMHGQLWDSPPVLQLFAEVLSDRDREPFLCVAADSDDYIDVESDCRLRISAIAADGSTLPNLKVNINLDGKRTLVPLPDGKHATANVSRAGLQHNVGNDLYRFMVEFAWDGGNDKRAVLIHTT